MSAGMYLRNPRLLARSFSSLAQMACISPARQIVSSSRVGMSQTRNSSVGMLGWGRRSHQLFFPLSIELVLTSGSTEFLYSSYDVMSGGMPMRVQCDQITLLYDWSALFGPIEHALA